MAITTEFIDFIVPIKTIKDKYPGGWKQCLKDHDYSIGRCVWYDEHLFRTGAMNPMDIEHLVKEWQKMGFNTHDENTEGNPIKWIDICVSSMLTGPTLECDWLAFDRTVCGYYLEGTDPGELIGRGNFEPTDKIPDWVFE